MSKKKNIWKLKTYWHLPHLEWRCFQIFEICTTSKIFTKYYLLMNRELLSHKWLGIKENLAAHQYMPISFPQLELHEPHLCVEFPQRPYNVKVWKIIENSIYYLQKNSKFKILRSCFAKYAWVLLITFTSMYM